MVFKNECWEVLGPTIGVMWYDRLCKVSLVLPEGNSGGNCDYSGGIRGYRSISGTARMVLEDTGGSQILPGGMRGCRNKGS